MDLSPQQIEAFDKIMAWMKDPHDQTFVLAGYAGAGKTTLAKYIAESIGTDDVVFCAYTGKAANVLRQKGCWNASTIHGLLYKFMYDTNGKNPVFTWNYDTPMKFAKLVIVDEYSMLNDAIIEDIHRSARKVLYLGDPFQLPPVKDGQTLLQPQFFIEEVHRQALESPILQAATSVRKGNGLALGGFGDFQHVKRSRVSMADFIAADQLIVGYNKTRIAFNKQMREARGIESPHFFAGEKIICWRNNRDNGLFNGMIGECLGIDSMDDNKYRMGFHCDGAEYSNLEVWRGDAENWPETRGRQYDSRSRLDRFDFAQALTCHKSQGSEFDNVIIMKEPVGTELIDKRRWLYTAITRAKKTCTLVEN